MKWLILAALAAMLAVAGCSGKATTLADLKDVPAEGETGEITYEDSGGIQAAATTTGIEKGNIAPDFAVTATDGKEIRMAELREAGPPVVVYFWATWCPYCKADLENVRKVYPEYADKVRFVAIDLDLNENAKLIAEYKQKGGHELIDFAPGYEQVLRDYSVTHTTTKYAVGRDGRILWKGSGVADVETWKILLKGLAES
ncbi:TlpA family protein disulfide reductase [Candidatus Woesearchaeota archaeon]|nr:TlpA family protein disulfide reductase [Candidatus Woesearchaeota archaeon]